MDVIVVLGAQNDASGKLSPMALARAKGALVEYRRRQGAKLIVTGGYGRFNPSTLPHAHHMAAHLIAQGVVPDDILAQIESAHTVEDAVLTRRFLDRLASAGHDGAPSWPMIVITSEVHVPRARLIFEHFFSPTQLSFFGTPNAVRPKRLQALTAHEATQIARIRQQGGVIYEGRLERRTSPHA